MYSSLLQSIKSIFSGIIGSFSSLKSWSKMSQFWPFSPKTTYFDQSDPINAIFDQIYVHKPDWNNFKKHLQKTFFTTFPKSWPVASFWPQNDPILTIFTKNDLFLPNWSTLMTFLPFWHRMSFCPKNDPILVNIGHFWWKWSKLGHFRDDNDVISQNLGKVVK